MRGRHHASLLSLSVFCHVRCPEPARGTKVATANCQGHKKQKKWNEMKIIDPEDRRDVTRAFLDLCVSSLRRGHENLGSFADLILDIRRLYAPVVLCIVPICVEKPGKRRAQVGLKG